MPLRAITEHYRHSRLDETTALRCFTLDVLRLFKHLCEKFVEAAFIYEFPDQLAVSFVSAATAKYPETENKPRKALEKVYISEHCAMLG